MNVLLIDDHALFREGLQYVLADLSSEIVLIEASSAAQAIELAEQNLALDLVLLDLVLSNSSGFDVLDWFAEFQPKATVVVLSASTERSDVDLALKKGARGFVSKSSSGEAMRNAIKLVMAGELYVPHHLMYIERRIPNQPPIELTPRQREVMTLVVQGLANKNIADRLNLAEPTVKMHISAIFQKLNVHSRTKAIAEINKRRIPLTRFD